MKIRSLSILALAGLLVLVSCKTQKKRGDLGPISQFYHNTTAEFNGYFNADVLITESMLSLDNTYQDNYNKILPVYKYAAVDNPRAAAGPLDQAIEKVTIVVSLHPESIWTDDCYLRMGQAQFLKQDFEASEETFEYLLAEFNPATMASKKTSGKSTKKKKSTRAKSSKKKKLPRAKKKKKKKRRKKSSRKKSTSTPRNTDSDTIKEEEVSETEPTDDDKIGMISLGLTQANYDDVGNGENYGLKHRPAHQEGMLWLARTYIERGDYPAAERLMGQLDRSPNTFEDVRRDLAAVQAHYYIKRKSYDQAVEHLERAIELEKDHLKQARYSFIIAQIHQRQGRMAQAYDSYERVLKFKPEYEMAFSAELNTIRSSWANGFTTADDARQELEKMTKDIKNVEYLDRIYFILATIDLKEGNKDMAIADLRKALDNSQGSGSQKADAYLMLGDLFFESGDYVEAKNYYDSTITVLPQKDEEYPRVKKLADNLTDIAANLEIIALQDSLLAISTMTEEEMRAFAFEIRKKENEARRDALLKQKENTDPRRPVGVPVSRASAGTESTFFAYNDRTLKRGERDFERNWGNRPLVDNWRRSSDISNTDLLDQQEELEIVAAVITDEDIEKVLANVPRTEADIRLANRKVEGALFALGRLYRDRLENNEKSIEALNVMLSRYPESDQRVEAWYYLYLAHTSLGHQAEAQKYYNMIIDNDPNSLFALILTDPEYANKAMDKESRLNQAYDQVYETFSAGNYTEASQLMQAARNEFGTNNTLQARFALLEAMITGNKEGKEAYVDALKDVIARYPSSPEETRAKEILRLLGASVASGPGRSEVNPSDLTGEEDAVFEVELDPTAMHYVIIVFDSQIDLAQAKVKVSDFNKQFYNVDRLKVANMYLGDAEARIPVIVIRRFNGATKAMEFYNTVQQNVEQFLGKDFNYQVYPISQTNYRNVLRSKSVEGYDPFFRANYLN
ncbi:MAG: tetratricopeptide repeat protein [Saprospiraceae bacterium]|nr:tetratricopeptide repeat protein [Saprospiraceae bacterium]